MEKLPNGAIVLFESTAHLVLEDALLRWTPGGYVGRRHRPRGRVDVVTPPTCLRVLDSAWTGSTRLLHPSSRAVYDK
jgi:hypothetical protein